MRLGQHYINSTTWPASINPSVIRIVQNLGHWDALETSRGVFNFAALDAYIAKIPINVEIIHVLHSIPTFYSLSNMTELRAALRVFLRAIAARYLAQGRKVYFENYNEGNVAFSGTLAQLQDIQREIWAAIKYGPDPTARVLTPSCVGDSGIDYLESFMPGLQSFDTIGFHPYATTDMQDLNGKLWRIRNVMRRQKLTCQLWMTEFGWGDQETGENFSSMPSATQSCLLKQAFGLMNTYDVSVACHFAYDDYRMGFKGNTAVEQTFESLRLKYA